MLKGMHDECFDHPARELKMTEMIFKKNFGYKWICNNEIWFKGYLQDINGKVYRDKDAINVLSGLSTFEKFKDFFGCVYGIFLVVIKRHDETWIANDVAGAIPIYYTDDAELISDDADCLKNSDKKYAELSPIRTFELYSTSFVGYKNTVYQHIKQLQIGSVCKLSKEGIVEQPYFIHKGNGKLSSEHECINKLHYKTNEMIQRIMKVVGERTVVISLSGGYDSRYVACSLKDNGVENVICYTYGKNGSFEVEQSKKVADALGYKWYNIQYDSEMNRALVNEKGYLDYANRPDYIAYIQNYNAVKSLIEMEVVPSDAVFITGLCNDMPTGFYIPDEQCVKKYGFSNAGVAEYSVEKRFVKFKISEKAKQIYLLDILSFLSEMGIEVMDYTSFISALDCLETSGFHTHCYLNMNAVHDYFGHEWLLPCWDRDMLQFWYDLSPYLRKHQYLYEKYIVENIGKKFGVGTPKTVILNSHIPFFAFLKRLIGGVCVRIAYPLGISINRNTDINSFAGLEVALYKAISQKNAIKTDRAGITLLFTIFMMERRYGNYWYQDVKGFLR